MEPRPTPVERLRSIRQSIDNIDAALVHLLAERFKFTQTVGHLKADAGMPPSDAQREVEQITRLRALAAESHLDPDFTEKFVNFIVGEVIQHHVRIASGASESDAGPIGEAENDR
ncbi:chorismate mutase [Frondihabitans sp. VKM Ac-2883]|jgi:chorismate mutase|uniref:chorismate mutase n=1 Tax=Frondihabitans sp. VKM Ac-2883 TaxID=2783823 RepID=UPI00188A6ED2|nr:chorismate mutase [Frondihabitans sp. VKM Ac-2883]MBF4575724.1 chorismate mutase [Frondihabitans sp. VKM Ac-2883]